MGFALLKNGPVGHRNELIDGVCKEAHPGALATGKNEAFHVMVPLEYKCLYLL